MFIFNQKESKMSRSILYRAVGSALLFLTASTFASSANAEVVDDSAVWAGYVKPLQSFQKKAIQANVDIPMDDGVRLRADIYYPALSDGSKAPGRFPVVVVDTCYGKSSYALTGYGGGATLFPLYGYVLVVVDARGTGASEGAFTVLDKREQRDGYDIVEWAAKQPFSDGRVGAAGFSYMGTSSTMIAATNPPSLKAAVSGGAPLDIYRTFLTQGGNWSSSSVLWFLLELLGTTPLPFVIEGNELLWHDPKVEIDTLLKRTAENGNSIPFRLEQVKNLAIEKNLWDNDFWRERAVDPRKITVPTLVFTGWNDLFLRDGPREYRELGLPPGQKQLVIGPWTHYTLPKVVGQNGISNSDEMVISWFDRWVKGINNGMERMGPVTLFDQGTKQWQRQTAWPQAGTNYQKWYLSGLKSKSAQSLNDGSLLPNKPILPGIDAGLLTPLVESACSRSTLQFFGGIPELLPEIKDLPCWKSQNGRERRAYTYTTAPFTEDTQISGPIAVHLFGSSTAKDATWVALVSDVEPDGTSVSMSEGALRTSRRALDTSRTIYTPSGDVIEPFHWNTTATASYAPIGSISTLDIEVWPVNWTIKKGHRVRLTIAASDGPHLVPTTTSLDRIGLLNVHRGGLFTPSHLLLPVKRP